MQKVKTLYTFAFPRKVEVSETETTTNDKGEEVTVTTKVPKEIPQEFALLRPTRSLLDDGELYYNVTVSKGVQAGLMSAALLAKRFINDGGAVSDPERDDWVNKLLERSKKEMAFQRISAKTNRTEEENKEHETLMRDIVVLNHSLQEFEVRQQSLFDITAEARARTRTIFWWLLYMLYRKNEKGEWVSFFIGDTFEEKQGAYDDCEDEELYPLEEERAINARAIQHAIQAVAFWYYGRGTNQESLEKALKEQTQ